MPQLQGKRLDLADAGALIGRMKSAFAFSAGLLALLLSAAPVSAQDQDLGETSARPEAEDPAPAFPTELILLPQDVQEAAVEGLQADEADIPEGLAVADEAYYRAQIAYVGEDWVSARQYAETAAAAGHAEGAMLAGLIARDGRVGEPDYVDAAQWFRRAAEADEAVALYQLGLLARMEDQELGLGRPRDWFERAARAGHVNAMVAFAVELRNSQIPQDGITAREWAERAANFGAAEGMYQYAQLLDAGVGGSVDKSGARHWFERAAEERSAEAAFQAGLMWADGEGGASDDAEAVRWLRMSAESGYGPAQGQYGLMLYQGRGVEQDVEAAAYWFREGGLRGDAESQFLYAYLLVRGEGVEQDYEESYRWALMASVDQFGVPVYNPDRDRLQAGLERGLPMATQQRIQSEVAASR